LRWIAESVTGEWNTLRLSGFCAGRARSSGLALFRNPLAFLALCG
jgi:hypothetical protein